MTAIFGERYRKRKVVHSGLFISRVEKIPNCGKKKCPDKRGIPFKKAAYAP
jgi:hypothetical protein